MAALDLPVSENAEIVDLGFVIADGEEVKYQYDGETLEFSFTDWKENLIRVVCKSVIAFKYQWAAYEYLEDERFDSCHIIHNSEWLNYHIQKEKHGKVPSGVITSSTLMRQA